MYPAMETVSCVYTANYYVHRNLFFHGKSFYFGTNVMYPAMETVSSVYIAHYYLHRKLLFSWEFISSWERFLFWDKGDNMYPAMESVSCVYIAHYYLHRKLLFSWEIFLFWDKAHVAPWKLSTATKQKKGGGGRGVEKVRPVFVCVCIGTPPYIYTYSILDISLISDPPAI